MLTCYGADWGNPIQKNLRATQNISQTMIIIFWWAVLWAGGPMSHPCPSSPLPSQASHLSASFSSPWLGLRQSCKRPSRCRQCHTKPSTSSTCKTSMHRRRNKRLSVLVERGFLFLMPSEVCLFSLLSKQRQICHHSFSHLLETQITGPL